jgi:hypothetical protein
MRQNLPWSVGLAEGGRSLKMAKAFRVNDLSAGMQAALDDDAQRYHSSHANEYFSANASE